MPTASDNFDRADNADLGSNWDVNTASPSRWRVFFQSVRPNELNLDAVESWNANNFGPDQFSQGTIELFTNVGGTDHTGVGVGVRWSGPGVITGYWFLANEHASLGATIAKLKANVFTVLAQASVAWAKGDVIRLEVEGNTLRGLKNGAVVLTVPGDETITGIRPALCFSGTTNAIPAVDNWRGGDLESLPGEGPTNLMAQSML